MTASVVAFALIASFCGTTLACLEWGRALARAARRRGREVPAGRGTVDGVVFGLLGLLLALTFTSSAARMYTRHDLVVEEANAIGTAWLRLDLLPPVAQPRLRDDFRRYTDARLAAQRALPDEVAARRNVDVASAIQRDIWAQAMAACRDATPQATMLVVPALNAMIDDAATGTAALYAHIPWVVYGFIGAVSLLSAIFAGFEMGRSSTRSWLHMVGFALVLACAGYLILDFEFPRFGFIHIGYVDQALVDVRRGMD